MAEDLNVGGVTEETPVEEVVNTESNDEEEV